MQRFMRKVWNALCRPKTNDKRRRTPLGVEMLEDRCTPTTSGTISGLVYLNSPTNGLAGAAISLTGTPSAAPIIPVNLTAVTDSNGSFTFSGLPTGSYHLSTGPFTGLTGTVTVGSVSASTGVTVDSPVAFGGGSNVVVQGGIAPSAFWLGFFLNTSADTDLPFAGTPGLGTPNNTPFVSTPIANQTLSSTATTKTIDLAGHFSDPIISDSSVTMNVTANGVANQKINLTLSDTTAPQAVANFFDYVNAGGYDNNIFFRNTNTAGDGIDILQAGGLKMIDGAAPVVNAVSFPTIPDEISALNLKGTLATANTGAANSASEQFFFNTADNPSLDHPAGSATQGYTVFGKVADAASQAILDSLSATPVSNLASHPISGFLLNQVPLNGGTVTDFPTTASSYLVINSVTINKRDEFLTYNIVANSNPTLVTAAITNEQLTLTKGTGTGTAEIIVQAVDRFGATVNAAKFTVTVS